MTEIQMIKNLTQNSLVFGCLLQIGLFITKIEINRIMGRRQIKKQYFKKVYVFVNNQMHKRRGSLWFSGLDIGTAIQRSTVLIMARELQILKLKNFLFIFLSFSHSFYSWRYDMQKFTHVILQTLGLLDLPMHRKTEDVLKRLLIFFSI